MPRVNFRPLLFCALGLAFGIFLYGKIAFGGFLAADLIFVALFLLFSLRPLSLKRTAAVLLCIFLCAGLGFGLSHVYTQRFSNTREAGAYSLSGTATSVTVKNGYSVVVLSDLFFDGEKTGGKCRVMLSEDIRTGDILLLQANVTPVSLDGMTGNSYTQSLYVSNVRYTASAGEYVVTGKSKNIFLKLNALLYDSLSGNMERDEASLAYALLTGNSGAVDGELLNAVRFSGVAHIFAVSGLHIGILFSLAYFCFRPLGKYRFLPAWLLALGYSALCAFTVSSVRAVIMCGVIGCSRAFGRKSDFLHSISFAAILILLFAPAQWYSAGFRLSFGACLGLALFSGTFSRAFKRIRLPRAIGGYLSATLSVQIFTFPVLWETFGYFPVWGILLNLVIVPLVPVLFIGLLLCAALALCIPPAAAFFLAFPQGMLSLFIFLFSVVDFSLVFTGFSLGAGGIVWLIACVALSPRIRISRGARAIAAAAFALVFCLCAVLENIVFTGCRITVYGQEGVCAALVRTRENSVLVIDDQITPAQCERFLSKTYGGTLDMVIVLSDNEVAAINVAAFLNTKEVRAEEECETGLRNTSVTFGKNFSCGDLQFYYESAECLSMLTEGVVVEFSFGENALLSADLCVGESLENLNFYLKDGIIKAK